MNKTINFPIYALCVVLGFLAWTLIFWLMRKNKNKQNRMEDVKGALLVGPLHFYLRGRHYTFTRRELVGWGLVLLFMLTAPLLTNWLEN